MILCSASPLLRQVLEVLKFVVTAPALFITTENLILQGNPCLDPFISLTDVPWTHMTWILQYIYSGQVAVPEEKFADFLTTAKMLQIATLTNSQVNLESYKNST